MELLTNAFAFVVVVGVMIFFHEFGHFITAKAFGMRVFVFSFGFGQRLVGFRRGDTDYRVSLIPLGGYVKLEGEPDDLVSEDTSALGDGNDFTSRPRWQRILVYLAGPAMNVVLTVASLTALFMVGFQVDASVYDRPVIGTIEPGSPAEQAGLQPGDEILAIDGDAQDSWEDAYYAIAVRPDADVLLHIRRDGSELDARLHSQAVGQERIGSIGAYPLVRIGEVLAGSAADQADLRADDAILAIDDAPITDFAAIIPPVQQSEGRTLSVEVLREGRRLTIPVTPKIDAGVPRLGIARKMVVRQFGPLRAAAAALRRTRDMTVQTIDVLRRLLTARLSIKAMSGPLGIAEASGEAARRGLLDVMNFVAMISLQIGILNLFPVPPLDGGHLAILFGESVIRRDFSEQVKGWIMNAGALMVLALIVLVIYSDLSKTSFLGKLLP